MPPSHIFVHKYECMKWLINMRGMEDTRRGKRSTFTPGTYVWHDTFMCGTYTFICVTWLIHTCDMTRLYVWKGEARNLSSLLVHMRGTTHSYVWHDSFICLTWLIHMYDMTHSYVWHVSFICMTWLIHMGDMTRAHVWHDTCTCVTWHSYTRDMTHGHV